MTDTPRETRVLEAVVSLVDTLLDDYDVVELLTALTERCAELLDVTSAGLLLADSRHQLHLLAATSEETHDLELFQLHAEQGPCLDCYTTGEPISVADLAQSETSWPEFVAAAVTAGFASVHAVPMRAAGSVLGALGLFSVRAGALNKADLTVAQTLAHVASVAVLQERGPTPVVVASRLRSALSSRLVVEQAKGFIRESLDVSVADAFVLLRDHAHRRGERLTDLCRRLMTEPASRPAVLAELAASGRHSS
jgi:transcriptional regulator with GAF, ATPase, and Fis domain